MVHRQQGQKGPLIEVDPLIYERPESEDYSSSGYDSHTTSLTSSINHYLFENGRRYHVYYGVEKNPMPTDEIEQDRMDMHHETMLLLMNRELHMAPLQNPQRILDIGTGTGIWAIDMADLYISAEVIGTDLSPIQPSWVPPNCRFEVDDAEREWLHEPNSFDFIHMRNLVQGISNWPKLMKEAYRSTRPGGYVELCETGAEIFSDDGTMRDDSPIKRYFELITTTMTSIGRPTAKFDCLVKRLRDAGFVDIQGHTLKEPMGPWPRETNLKQAGMMMLLQCDTAFHAYGMAAFTRILGMDPEEANEICAQASKAVRNKNTHAYNEVYVVYGRKPDPNDH